MVNRLTGLENVQYKSKERRSFSPVGSWGVRSLAGSGLSVNACYRWRREATCSIPRAKSRSCASSGSGS